MIRAAAVQMHAVPGEYSNNTSKALAMTEQAAEQGADLIVLPELFSSGYHLSEKEFRSLAETPSGRTVAVFQKLAEKEKTVLVVPFPEIFEGRLYNTAAVIDSDGRLCHLYRKSFLWGREKDIFTPGDFSYEPADTSAGRIGVLICADAEFPEPGRMLALKGAELIVIPSVWSTGAQQRWDIQLPARALDNTVYVLGVNTVHEGSCGKSKFVRPDGSVVGEASSSGENLLMEELDFSIISSFRREVPYLKDLPSSLHARSFDKAKPR